MPRTAGSLLANLEVLARGAAGPAGAALLGARWSFALPRPALRESLAEFSPPAGLVPFFATLAARTGVRVTEGNGGGLHAHLAAGGAAVVAVDVFHLPYRPAFGRVHSGRTVRVRQGPVPGQVWVDDDWPPTRSGLLDAAVLDRARVSPVPRDEVREPVYAGTPIDGEWWAVRVDGAMRDALPGRADALLDELRREAVEGSEDGDGAYGLAALAAFRAEVDAALAAVPGRTFLRTSTLLLRAELGSRVYLCALLAAAARWTGCAELACEAAAYHRTLREMEAARDVLAKSLARFRPEYAPFVSGCLARAEAGEQRLAEILARHAQAGAP